MRKIFNLTAAAIAFVAVASLFNACSKDKPLVRLAKEQMPASIDSTLTKKYGEIKGLEISSVALVYEDDSICILQCEAKAEGKKGKKILKQYRYVYLFDVNMSNMNSKMIFCENLTEMPLMPEERIKNVLKDLYKDKVSVYNSQYVLVRPILHPVNNKFVEKEQKEGK